MTLVMGKPVKHATNVMLATVMVVVVEAAITESGGKGIVLLPSTMPLSLGRTVHVFPETTAVGPPALIVAPLASVIIAWTGWGDVVASVDAGVSSTAPAEVGMA